MMNLMNKKMKYVDLKSHSGFAIYVPKNEKSEFCKVKTLNMDPVTPMFNKVLQLLLLLFYNYCYLQLLMISFCDSQILNFMYPLERDLPPPLSHTHTLITMNTKNIFFYFSVNVNYTSTGSSCDNYNCLSLHIF